MQDAIEILAGDCTLTYEGGEGTVAQRGAVVAVVKPDDTLLVHDATGYQPAAWLTRADGVRRWELDDGVRLVASKGEERLSVECHAVHARVTVAASPAGPPVGDCPTCDGELVRATGRVVCVACGASHGIPRDATVLESTCADCALPKIAVERGERFEVCVDYDCESLDDAVRDRFDGRWTCPDCARPLQVNRRYGLRVSCPDCEVAHPLPVGTFDGTCECGLPAVAGDDGPRCLDDACDGRGAG